MFQQFFQQQTNRLSDSFEKPVKELMDLNAKTLQSLAYMTPKELLTMRKPEDIMERNMQMMIANGQIALAYVHNMFGIMEKHWLTSDNMHKNHTSYEKPASHTLSNYPKKSAKKTMSKTTKTDNSKVSSVQSKTAVAKSTSVKKPSTKSNTPMMTKSTKQPVKSQTTVTVKHESANKPHVESTSPNMKSMMDSKK